jgi:hypothetical protein
MERCQETFTIYLLSGAAVTVDVEVDLDYDENYGADADGNRGTTVYSIDEVFFDTPDLDDDGELLSDADKAEFEDRLMAQVEYYRW